MFCKDCDKFYNVVSIFPNTEPSIKGIDCLDQEAFVMTNSTTLNLSYQKTDYISTDNKASITASLIGGNGGYKYKLGSGEYQSSNVFSGLNTGSYTLYAKDRNNNEVSTTVKISKQPIFVAKSVVLYGNTITYTTTDTFSTYSWSVTGGTIISGANTKTVQISFPTVGNTVVTVNTTDSIGATGTYSYNVEVTDSILVNAKAVLQGPVVYNISYSTFYMHDTLRIKGYVPLEQPYGKSPYNTSFYVNVNNSGNETTISSVIGEIGYLPDLVTPKVDSPNSVVDWVYLQLRTKNSGAEIYPVHSTRSALILRNGKIVDVDGVSPVKFKINSTNTLDSKFYLVIKHRNHLGAMTAFPLGFNLTNEGYYQTEFDFSTDNSTWTNTNSLNSAQITLQQFHALRAGNANGDDQIRTQGSNTDITALQTKVGLLTPNNIVSGYFREDVSMDGKVEYTGGDKTDNFVVALAVGLNTPTNIIFEQLPPTS